ncbi:MAG: hypothetical protein U9R49_12165, partial [Bacteroidota bacterium]|nr:hypothetical protein [Bacteroidota bacterium]
AAREVSGCRVYFDPHHEPESIEVHDDMANLMGYQASDQEHGVLGTISDYLPHPMNPVFIIQSGSKELMVPAVHAFIEHIDSENQSVHFILPEGLTDL